MSTKKRQTRGNFIAACSFIDGRSSYVEKYRLWRKTKNPIVPRLVGVFDIPIDDYLNKGVRDHLTYIQRDDLAVIDYDPDSEEYYQPSSDAGVAGYTCSVRTSYGNVHPIIFMRDTAHLPNTKNASEDQALNSLMILLHELGHAEDIVREVNYDHDVSTFDSVGTEAYAHAFAVRYAKLCNYKLLLLNYCRNLLEDLSSGNEVYQEAAKRVCETHAIDELHTALLKEFGSKVNK